MNEARTGSARIIDGKASAARLRADIARRVAVLASRHGVTPGLAVVLVGDDPASQVYVRNKGRQTREAGMQSFETHLPTTASEDELLAQVARLNADPAVHGILVQLPLPSQIRETAVIDAIAPAKDVDGFHVINTGLLASRGSRDHSLHATRLPAAAARIRRQPGRDASRDRRPLEHRRQADGPVAAARELHGDTRALAHA